jgi:hypothetical protein
MTELMEYQDVIDRVRSGIAGVKYAKPAPDRRPRRSRRMTMAIAGVALIVLITALVLGPSRGTSLVWAAEPEVVTEADIEEATVACQKSLDAQDPSLDIRVGILPPMVLMDLRGDRAVATFREGGRYVVCLLDTTTDPWEGSIFSAIPYGTEETGTPEFIDGVPVLTEPGFQHGDIGEMDGVGIVSGAVGPTVVRVVFQFTVPDLGTSEATMGEGAFAIWWPALDDCRVELTMSAFAADGSLVAKEGHACWPTPLP